MRPDNWQAAAVIACACAPFLWCMTGKFVYDDNRAILNPVVEGKVPWIDAWTTDFWGLSMNSRFSHKSYRPLAVLTFRLNAILFGVEGTTSYHVVCMLLHAVNSVLVSKVMRACGGDGDAVRIAAFVASLLFAVHPVHTETVRSAGSDCPRFHECQVYKRALGGCGMHLV